MKSKVIIIMDGGCVQSILCDSEDVEAFVIDYDVLGDEEDLFDIPWEMELGGVLRNGIDKAMCWEYPPEVNPEEVERLHEIIVNSYKNED
jgi:hypothetical protein